MNTNQKLHQARLSEWAVRFQEQAKCGLTVKDWCVENGFTVHTFYYWKHLLKEEYAESVLPDIVPIHTTQTNHSASLSVSSDIHPLTFVNTQPQVPYQSYHIHEIIAPTISPESRDSRHSHDFTLGGSHEYKATTSSNPIATMGCSLSTAD